MPTSIKVSQRFLGILCSILISITFLSGVFTILARSRTLEKEIFLRVPPIAQDYAQPYEREIVASAVRAYLSQGKALPSGLFTDRERAHMTDVRRIFELVRTLTIIFLIGSISVIWFGIRMRKLDAIFFHAAIMTAQAVIFFGVSSIFFFDALFGAMHRVLFSNDLWQLDPSLHALIRSYPPDFFNLFAMTYVAIVMACICAYVGIRAVYESRIGRINKS